MGSTNSNLHNLSIDLYNCCLQFNVTIEPVWLPREHNERADELSRIIDPDDWSLNPIASLRLWTSDLVRIQSIDLRPIITLNYPDIIPDIGTPAAKLPIVLLRIGLSKTTGYIPQFPWY